MGCVQSRIDNQEIVTRCKERRNRMKEAVLARNAFAAAHSGYAVALKNSGAALSDYVHGESDQTLDHPIQHQQQPIEPVPQPPPPPPPPIDNLPPSPHLPNFSRSPIKRAISMPTIAVKGRTRLGRIDSMAIEEEGEEEEAEKEEEKEGSRRAARRDENESTPLHTPENVGRNQQERAPQETATPPSLMMQKTKNMAWDYFYMEENVPSPSLDDGEIGSGDETRDNLHEEEESFVQFGRDMGNNNNVPEEIEPKTPENVEEEEETVAQKKNKGKTKIEHFKPAPSDFRSRAKISFSNVNLIKILNEVDDRFLRASESAQEVSKLLEAARLHYHTDFADNRGYVDHSARVMRVITWNRSSRGVSNMEGGKDDVDSEEYETHAMVLDKLLAWEKKLYDEVKQGEPMKAEYRRKVSSLNKQKTRGASTETLEITKAAASHLHTRYIVDMESMDSTISEVNRLRDEQLYLKLVSLVEGMAKMWGNMCIHHDTQLQIVEDLKSLEISHSLKEKTKLHHEQTQLFCNGVEEWQAKFGKLVMNQKQYINALSSWLKLNLIPIESSLNEKISSPPRPERPLIQALLHSWHDYLEKLPDEVARSAISSFVAVIKTILLHQEEEMKLKEKCEETRREFLRKDQDFEEWYQKYMQKRGCDQTEVGEETNLVSERRFAVESLRKRLEDDAEAHQMHCLQVREKSLNSLKIRLPELFRALSDYAHACADAYEKLKVITKSQESNAGGSS